MHELSIAQSIIEIIKQAIPHSELANVASVRMKIGEQAGVVSDSLVFSFQALTDNSSLKNASLEIEKIPFVLFCTSCQKESTNEIGFLSCPECGSAETKILSGTELQVVDITVMEHVKEDG